MSEIIIDGCNVAECEFFGKYNVCKAYVNMPKPCGCEYNPDCYFKQLQRAKAELEQYKKSKQASYEAMQREWNKAVNELRDVEAENERLKNRNKLYKKIIVENQQKYHNQIMVLKSCIKGEINVDDFKNYAKFQQENKMLKKVNNQVKQKLDEIMTEDYTNSDLFKPFELIDECRHILCP